MVNQGPRQSNDEMFGKRVCGMRRLKAILVALGGRQSVSTSTIMVRRKD